MGARRDGTIPAFLSIDVEPAGFQLPRRMTAAAPWPDCRDTIDFAEQLRSRLAARGGGSPRFGWYFRTDPQVAEVYGRADQLLRAFPDEIARLEAHGDYLGVHIHPIRWSEGRRCWVHDFADTEWLVRCTSSALEAYAEWSGGPCRRSRMGAGFFSNEIVETLERHGVQVELGLEPVAGWGITARKVTTGIDTSPMLGVYTDCRTAPQVPFRPSHHDFLVADNVGGRDLVMVPMTTGPPLRRRPIWRRLAVAMRGSPREVLYPTARWPSARFFWDAVAREVDAMRRPYVSFAIRTDDPESLISQRAHALFEALPQHPLVERLRFGDPLDALAELV